MYVFEIILFLQDILHKLKVWQCLGDISSTSEFLKSLLDYCFASCIYNWKGVAIYMTSPNLIVLP